LISIAAFLPLFSRGETKGKKAFCQKKPKDRIGRKFAQQKA
jgi:hypothetical protein